MKLDKLTKTVNRTQKRLGRGYGSGKGGHTSSRGAKGKKARGKNKLLFEGVKTKKSLIKRLPFIRGKGKLKTRANPTVVGLSQLSVFKQDELVNQEALYRHGLISRPDHPVKLVANGDINTALRIDIPTSQSAKDKVIKAGGKLIDTITNDNSGE